MKTIGKIYSITNNYNNEVEIIDQLEDGTLKSYKKVSTHGQGSENHSIFHNSNRADPQLSAYATIISSDNKYLFTINGAENSVSSFKINCDGDLTLINKLQSPNYYLGTISSLAYNSEINKLYINCYWGDHLTIFDVTDGYMTPSNVSLSLNTFKYKKRSCPSITLTPDNKYLLACIHTETTESTKENIISTEDNFIMIELTDEGYFKNITHKTISKALFSSTFINDKQLIISCGASQNIVLATYENDDIKINSAVSVNPFLDQDISETCWQTYDEKTNTIYATNFAYGTITSVKLESDKLFKLNDQEDYVEGSGLDLLSNGHPYSGALDILILNRFIYVIYNSNGLLRAYSINDDGSLTIIDNYKTIAQNQFSLAGLKLL